MVDQPDIERDEVIARAAASLREPVALAADFDERVMREVRGLHALQMVGREEFPAPVREMRVLPWILRPRTLRMSPLAGLAAAAAIAAVTLIVPRMTSLIVPPIASTVATEAATNTAARATAVLAAHVPAADAKLAVSFVLVAPDARSVSVAGSFNDWDTSSTHLKREAGGVWTAQVPLSVGRYTYSFVIDGTRWQADPVAPRSADDDFGAPSSVLTVSPR